MNIEDYIELLANTNPNIAFNLDTRDTKLIKSFAEQIKKEIAFTDRQHNLAMTKLIEYRDQFEQHGYFDIEKDFNNLRYGYRVINREKTIKLVNREHIDIGLNVDELKLAVRFPYSKKMIKYIDFIRQLQDKYNDAYVKREYDQNTKTHFLSLTEKIVIELIGKLKDCNFEIDPVILEYYETVYNFQQNFIDYMPGIYNYELRNVHNKCRDYAVNLLGHPCEKNLVLYYDRRDTLGLKHFDQEQLLKSINKLQFKLSKLIAEASTALLHLPPSEFSVTDLIDALWELKRFPVLVKLKTNYEKDDLYNFYEAAIKYVNPTDISVLFRLDSTSQQNINFNTAIKELGLNNPLHDNTKMVFLNFNKIPKPLLRKNWKPETTILMESTRFSSEKISRLYDEFSNLIIHYDSALNYFMKRKNYTVITNII